MNKNTFMQIHNLRKLVSSGNTILHGSPKEFFEVRPTRNNGEMVVCATVVPEIALYHELLIGTPGGRKRGIPGIRFTGEWSCIEDEQNRRIFTIRITQKKLEFLLLHPKLQGYVYPMDTYDFEKRGLSECRLHKSRFLRTKILITEEDLPFTPIPGHLEYKLILPYKFKSHFGIEGNTNHTF